MSAESEQISRENNKQPMDMMLYWPGCKLGGKMSRELSPGKMFRAVANCPVDKSVQGEHVRGELSRGEHVG